MNCQTKVSVGPGQIHFQRACTCCGKDHAPCQRIDQFYPRHYYLNAPQIKKITEVAQVILRQRRATGMILLTAHLDGQEFRQRRFHIAQRRLWEVRQRLLQTMERLRPGSTSGLKVKTSFSPTFQPVSADQARNRRVEVCFKASAGNPVQRQSSGLKLILLHRSPKSGPR